MIVYPSFCMVNDVEIKIGDSETLTLSFRIQKKNHAVETQRISLSNI